MADAPTDPTPAPKPVSSQLARLRQKRQKAGRKRKPLRLDVPNYGGELVAEYRDLELGELLEINAQIEESAGDRTGPQLMEYVAVESALKVIIRACKGLFTREPDGSLLPLNEDPEIAEEEPIGFDVRLAKALEIEAETAKEVVRSVIGDEKSIVHLGSQIKEWTESTAEEIDRDF